MIDVGFTPPEVTQMPLDSARTWAWTRAFAKTGFGPDTPVEGDGFEPSVPRRHLGRYR